MRPILRPELVVIAKVGGEPAGCAFALPDPNPLIKKIRGRLLPFGWLQFLAGVRSLRSLRAIGVACLPEYRNIGVTAVLVERMLQNGLAGGFQSCEFSWVDSANTPAYLHNAKTIAAHPSKRYVILEKSLLDARPV
jgi:hypothetical protein